MATFESKLTHWSEKPTTLPVPTIRRQSLVQTSADHLRAGFRSGRWRGHLPGVGRLAEELGVSKDTVRAALHLLETSGSLEPQGAGKSRKILAKQSALGTRSKLRVGLLLPMPLHEDNSLTQRLILGLRSAIEAAGHFCVSVCQPAASYKAAAFYRRMTQLVAETEADAWVVYSASHGVLKWFSDRSGSAPALALGGHLEGLPMASSRTNLVGAMHECVDVLSGLGHRRIVLISPDWWRTPAPNFTARALLSRLAHHGIPASDYNLPEWEETAGGLEILLEALFRTTPPTALLLAEPSYCCAARAWLGERGLRVPRDVSLVNILPDPIFQFQRPTYTEFSWPENGHVQHILRWLKNICKGRVDLEAFTAYATFSMGETIAPSRRG